MRLHGVGWGRGLGHQRHEGAFQGTVICQSESTNDGKLNFLGKNITAGVFSVGAGQEGILKLPEHFFKV